MGTARRPSAVYIYHRAALLAVAEACKVPVGICAHIVVALLIVGGSYGLDPTPEGLLYTDDIHIPVVETSSNTTIKPVNYLEIVLRVANGL